MKKDKRFERDQADVNTMENRRKYWERNLSDDAKKWFDEDARYFLHQSLSTPVLNVLSRARGIYIEDIDGNKYIDMHGNGVHNAGFNNPAVIEAVKKQLDGGLMPFAGIVTHDTLNVCRHRSVGHYTHEKNIS